MNDQEKFLHARIEALEKENQRLKEELLTFKIEVDYEQVAAGIL